MQRRPQYRGAVQEELGLCLRTDVVDMLKSVSTSLVPCAPPQKPLNNSLSLCVRLCENCHFLFQSTYFESGVWGTCRLLFCPVSPSRCQVRSQEVFSGGKQNLKNFTLRHVLAGCGPYKGWEKHAFAIYSVCHHDVQKLSSSSKRSFHTTND